MWLSIDALVLFAIQNCGGFDSEKAKVFHRVVDPDYCDVIMISDKDIRTSYHFLIVCATILQELIVDIKEKPSEDVNYELYLRKLKKYEPTFDGMMEDFEDSIFGKLYNRRNQGQFIEMIASSGWMYF